MDYATLRPWVKGIGGSTAITFALMALPVFAVFGFAVDASRQVSLKKHAQAAVDVAALAGARMFVSRFDATAAETQAGLSFAENIATAHGDVVCNVSSITADVEDLTVRVEASCAIPPLLGKGISGKSEIIVDVASQAAALSEVADVAMMFDVSSSMGPAELAFLKTAGKRAAQIVIGTQSGVRGRVSVVPFASGVNAGDFGNLASGRLPNADPEGDDGFGLRGGATIDRVCVTERLGPESFTDASPTAGQHVGPPTTLSETVASANYVIQSYRGCPNSPLHPLDSDLGRVKAAIDALARSPSRAAGNTAGHMGIAWSWYTISPNWSNVWTASTYGGHSRHDPHPYGDPAIKKIAILMTDGRFQHGFNAGFGDTVGVRQVAKAEAAAEAFCANMRAAGITIYAIGYDLRPAAEAVLANCAGDPNNVFFTDSARNLEGIYELIAGRYLSVGLTD